MEMTSENKKTLYDFIDESGNEAVKALVPLLRGDLVTAGRVETDLEAANGRLKEFDEMDIAGMKAASEFMEKNGGSDKLLDLKAKAEGYAEDKSRIEAEKQAATADAEKYKQEAETRATENKRLSLVNETTGAVGETFNTSSLILNNAIDSGYLYTGENGAAMVKVGDVSKPLTDGGMELLKGVDAYKDAVKTPAGTNQPLGGVPSSATNNGTKNLSLAQRLDAAIK